MVIRFDNSIIRIRSGCMIEAEDGDWISIGYHPSCKAWTYPKDDMYAIEVQIRAKPPKEPLVVEKPEETP